MENGDLNKLPAYLVKAKAWGVLFATIAVPLLVAILGSMFANAAKEREIGVRYVELAIGILTAEPKGDSIALRIWATDVLSHYSEVALSAQAKKVLEQQRLELTVHRSLQEMDRSLRELDEAIRQREQQDTKRKGTNKP